MKYKNKCKCGNEMHTNHPGTYHCCECDRPWVAEPKDNLVMNVIPTKQDLKVASSRLVKRQEITCCGEPIEIRQGTPYVCGVCKKLHNGFVKVQGSQYE